MPLVDRRRAKSVLDLAEVDARFTLGRFSERDDADFTGSLRMSH